jgi:hypothetical protein
MEKSNELILGGITITLNDKNSIDDFIKQMKQVSALGVNETLDILTTKIGKEIRYKYDIKNSEHLYYVAQVLYDILHKLDCTCSQANVISDFLKEQAFTNSKL